MRRWFVGLSAFVGCTSVVLACAPGTDCDFGLCAGPAVGGDGGEGGVGDAATDAPMTDPCVSMPSAPQCLSDATALFVSGSKGNDATGQGTRAAPFKTIGAAFPKVSAVKPRIYVCEGTYAERVNIKVPVSLLGGLACDWTAKGKNPKVAPANGMALTITSTSGVAIIDVDITGNADTQVAGDSAIAAFVANSTGVLFRGSNISAGPGVAPAPAADGDASPNWVSPIAASGVGATDAAGGAPPLCIACSDATSSAGGRGAPAGALATGGSSQPPVGIDNSGSSGASCTDGKPGAPGAAGMAAEGAARPGNAALTGWVNAVAAKKGANGGPGQGGGGGGALATGIGGGSGGCGGCGGSGGMPGHNGGSSIALLAFQADVAVESSTLMSSAGAAGTKGGKGEDGELRGGAGGGQCVGGVGGNGAGGGGGGGGAGGHSAPIAYSGTAPTTTTTMLKPGSAGDLGAGGDPGGGSGLPGMAGKPGAKGSSMGALPL